MASPPPVAGKGQRADGTMIYANFTGDDTTFVLVACAKTITPPPQEQNEVDDKCLEDLQESVQPGVEALSEFVFTRNYDPLNATVDAQLQTLYDNKSQIKWRLVFPFTTPSRYVFEGNVYAIRPTELSNGEMIMAEYAVRRRSAITIEAHTP